MPYAKRLVHLHDEMVDKFNQSDMPGHLSLGITEDITAMDISKLLIQFTRQYPRVVFENSCVA